jgi:hypothetical protein
MEGPGPVLSEAARAESKGRDPKTARLRLRLKTAAYKKRRASKVQIVG